MGRFKVWAARTFFGEFFTDGLPQRGQTIRDASTAGRELTTGTVKRLGIRYGDITSKDFEEAEFDLSQIDDGYNTDSYIRQGVDKYVDQIFKEGFQFYGRDTAVVDYIRLRFSFMAEATGIPTEQLFTEIAEDVVKYGNCFLAKSRVSDQASLPPTVTVTGIAGAQPIGGYFPINATTMQIKRDKNGVVQQYQQEVDDTTVKFKAEDMIHIYYKREKGNAFGTPFLHPVLDDVRALRQAEENVLKMMYRNIYPFFHVMVGDDETPGGENEINEVKDQIDGMEVDGGLVTTNRVEIKPIASNQVINAQPYLQYLEERVFSGMGIPAILFGRGGTANRSTGDNMTSEMADRIRAIQRIIEVFVNEYIIKELLLEGGFDPVLNPEHVVEFRFNENELDSKVKRDTHYVYLYEHNAITEDEMRKELGRDPITDRALMHQTLITQANEAHSASVRGGTASSSGSNSSDGTKATNNKQKPTNQYGTKSSPKKVTNKEVSAAEGLLKDQMELLQDELHHYKINHTLSDQLFDQTIQTHRELCLAIVDEMIKEKRKRGSMTNRINRAFDQVLVDFNIQDADNRTDQVDALVEGLMMNVLNQKKKGG